MIEKFGYTWKWKRPLNNDKTMCKMNKMDDIMKSKREQKTTLSFILIGILICSAVILALGINQSILELLKLLAIMLFAGVTNLRVFPVFIVILITIFFSLPLGLLSINLINIDKQCASTKLILGVSLGIALMTASFTLMGLIGIPITRFTLLTNYLIILLFLLLMNKGKGYKSILNLRLNSTESFNRPIFFLFLILFIMIIYPALRYPAPASADWMGYGLYIQGIIHSSTITGFYWYDLAPVTDPLLLIYPQGFFVFITFLYHITNIPVHILLLSFGYFTGFMLLLMIYTIGHNFFKSKYIAALAVISVLCIEGLSRLDSSGFTWIFSLFLSSVFIFLYYETMKKYNFKKALLTGIPLGALFMSNPVIALSISLVPIIYITSFIIKEIISKNFIRIEDIKPHVIPLLTGVILSIPIFLTNYVPMLHIAMSPSTAGTPISIPIYTRLLNNLYNIYRMNGGEGLFSFPFQSFALNSVVGIITFLPILVGLFFCLNQRKDYQKLVVVLLFSSLVTYVVPRTLNMPAPKYSAHLLFVIPFCLLCAIGISEIYKLASGSERLKLKHIRITHIMLACIILFAIFGFVRTSAIIGYNSYQDAGFLANSANVEAALWLKENSPPNSVILNSPGSNLTSCTIRGDFIPIVSNQETVYTRHHRAIEFSRRTDQYWDTRAKECVSTFCHPTANTSYLIWKKHNISYVFVTNQWYDLGSFFESPFLELEYFKEGVAIFKVNPDGMHSKSNNLVHFEAEKSNIYGNATTVDMTKQCYGIYVNMPVGSKIVIDLVPVNDRIQKNPQNSEVSIRVKHFVGPLHMPLKLSIGNNTRIIDKTSDKFRFITTEMTFPTDTVFQGNNLSIGTVSSDIHLLPPSSLLQLAESYQGTMFFQFCPMVDWIQIQITNDKS